MSEVAEIVNVKSGDTSSILSTVLEKLQQNWLEVFLQLRDTLHYINTTLPCFVMSSAVATC
jgi:hypothetical protein